MVITSSDRRKDAELVSAFLNRINEICKFYPTKVVEVDAGIHWRYDVVISIKAEVMMPLGKTIGWTTLASLAEAYLCGLIEGDGRERDE